MTTRRRRNLIDHVLAETATCVCIVDIRRRIRFFSPGMEQWTGWPASKIEGLSCDAPTDEATAADLLASALNPPQSAWQGDVHVWEAVLPTASDRVVQATFCMLPVAGRSGQIESIVIMRTRAVSAAAVALPVPLAQRLHAEIAALRNDFRKRGRWDSFLGNSEALTSVRQLAEMLRHSFSNFNIVGPPGSGRRHLARCIHAEGRDAEYSFVPVYCDLLTTADLYEVIRGISKTARTGTAAHDKTGLLLFVDIDRIPREVQQWVLDRPADESIRVAGTSSVSLQDVVDEGWMLSEFQRRIAPVEIQLPSLHERDDDVLLLTHEFIQENRRLRNTTPRELSAEVAELFRTYRWPGNVREVRQIIHDACDACPGNVIRPDDLPFAFRAGMEAQSLTPATSQPSESLDTIMQNAEREILQRTMAACNGNKAETAHRLGLTRPSLYRRLASLGLE